MAGLSIGQAWDEAKVALQRHRRLLVPVALGLVLLPATLASMVEPKGVAGVAPDAGPSLTILLALALVMAVGQLAIVLLVNGWRGSVGDAIVRGLRRLPVMIAAALVVLGPLFVLSALALAMVALASGETGQFSVAGLTGAGRLVLLLIMVAVLYVSVRLMTLSVVTVEGDDGPIASLKRSFAMTSGHFWRLFGFLLLLFAVFLLVSLAIGAVVGSLAVVLFGKAEQWSVSLLLVALAGGLAQTGFVLVYTAMLARITAQLDGRKA